MKKFRLSFVLFLILMILFSCKGTPSRKPSGDNGGSGGGSPSSSPSEPVDATKLFVEVVSGEDIRLDLTNGPADKYDIYYMYTNTNSSNDVSIQGLHSDFRNYCEVTGGGMQPLSLTLKSEGSSVGDIVDFSRIGENKKLKSIRAKLVKKVENIEVKENNGNGRRNLEIWEEVGLDEDAKPTPSDYGKIAECFLTPGYDNDIYDILTKYCGSDKGNLNSAIDASLIDKTDTITLLYCDLGDQGTGMRDKKGVLYEAGNYWNIHNFKKSSHNSSDPDDERNLSNERNMITLHAYAVKDVDANIKFLGNSILTLAHEFQHLLHAQYFNIKNVDDSIHEKVAGGNDDDYSDAIDECFSSMIEEYLANFIQEKIPESEARDPFYVTANGNKSGYISSVADNDSIATDSMASEYLKYYHEKAIDRWVSGADDDAYGVVAVFAHYLLCNYGMDIIEYYRKNAEKKGNISGIVQAINDMDSGSDMTRGKLLQNFGISTLLSRQKNIKKPYSFNNQGWIDVSDKKVPSVNLWLYSYEKGKKGFKDFIAGSEIATNEYIVYGTNQFLCKEENKNFSAGVFEHAPINVPNGLKLTIIAVPVVE